MSAETAFARLGLAPGASPEEAQVAYRNLCKTEHPDVGGRVEDFVGLTEAFYEAYAYAQAELCPECKGVGSYPVSGAGWSPVRMACLVCNGSGKRHK